MEALFGFVSDHFHRFFSLPFEIAETVHHQVLCKQKLVLELEKDRKRLERMQRELQAIQAPMPDGGLDGLNQEIEKLRNDCKMMAQYVEEAGPSYGKQTLRNLNRVCVCVCVFSAHMVFLPPKTRGVCSTWRNK